MTPPVRPRPLERRPVYSVVPDPPRGWRVKGTRGRRGRGGFPDRPDAVAHAEGLAAGHPVAQIRVYGPDGSLERDEGVRHRERAAAAQQWLEAYLAPWRDYRHARSLLVEEQYVEDRPVAVCGGVFRLFVAAHEGQAWDEVHVHGSLSDEAVGPLLAEVSFYVMG